MKIPPQAKKVFTGIIFDVYQWQQEMFDGSSNTFEMLKRTGSVNIIATVDNKIIIIEDDQPVRGIIQCIPAGRVDGDEETLKAAQRELLEETGYSGTQWKLLTEEQPYSKIDWTVSTFIARNAIKIREPHLDAGERIKVSFVSFDEFIELARDENFRIPNTLRHILWEALLNPNKKTELRSELGLQ